MACTLFREASTVEGKPGDLSYRRVASAVLLVAALALFVAALVALRTLAPLLGTMPWVVFIPGALCLGVGALMPILTTITDLKALASIVTGKGSTSATSPAPAKDGL